MNIQEWALVRFCFFNARHVEVEMLVEGSELRRALDFIKRRLRNDGLRARL